MNDKELREALEALRRLVEESVEAGTPISGPLLLLKLNGILAAHPTEPAEDRWTAVMEKRARALAKAYWRGRGEEITKEQEDEFWWSFARDAQMLSKDEPAERTGLREHITRLDIIRILDEESADISRPVDCGRIADRILALTAPAPDGGLREYAEHKPGCAKYINWMETNCAPRHSVVQFEYDDNQQCSCGLDAALRAQPPEGDESE